MIGRIAQVGIRKNKNMCHKFGAFFTNWAIFQLFTQRIGYFVACFIEYLHKSLSVDIEASLGWKRIFQFPIPFRFSKSTSLYNLCPNADFPSTAPVTHLLVCFCYTYDMLVMLMWDSAIRAVGVVSCSEYYYRLGCDLVNPCTCPRYYWIKSL